MTRDGNSEETSAYDANVFINCPFDSRYFSLLRPLLFTVTYLGFRPRIASERSDSGENRVDKICDLIRQSRFSIHDLSRLKAERADEFYRLNMPFELGIDYGARRFCESEFRDKRFLILEKQRYDYQKALSDLSGVDIKSHDGEPEEVVRAVRDWFVETAGLRGVATATVIWWQFGDFTTAFYETMKAAGSPKKDRCPFPSTSTTSATGWNRSLQISPDKTSVAGKNDAHVVQ